MISTKKWDLVTSTQAAGAPSRTRWTTHASWRRCECVESIIEYLQVTCVSLFSFGLVSHDEVRHQKAHNTRTSCDLLPLRRLHGNANRVAPAPRPAWTAFSLCTSTRLDSISFVPQLQMQSRLSTASRMCAHLHRRGVRCEPSSGRFA